MQEAPPIGPGSPVNQPQTPAVDPGSATDQFGLSFESLLQIVLTQLTFQDPLEPMDNFEFVSQLAQFSQIQLSQETNDNLERLVAAQTTSQGSAVLGQTVDVSAGASTISGVVRAVAFEDGTGTITLETPTGQTISGLPLANISQIRETP
ncbi:flagellar hook capping FlgD N-terminal domain-containing protein [uncultured Erythrobacter sp.]|uniref:flagellar hook assembly protein FlgD n=1 Tax=uncultured Erythrobacter sp. TaxID=263913 RepID=UPI00260ED6CB|nr:flagellar hook capping FlgD N-terminal domain-containing protein [uncultured Erythrobacter sp.]